MTKDDLKKSLQELYPDSSGVSKVSYGNYIKVIRNGNVSYFIKDGDDIILLNGNENRRYKKDSIHNQNFTSLFREINLDKLGI